MCVPPLAEPMESAETEQAVSLVTLAMNPEQGEYARRTFERHFSLKSSGIDDGRAYYVLYDEGAIIGMISRYSAR